MNVNRHREPIILNIYHVTNVNKFFEFFGFGLYHTSVGVYGMEFSYGGHDAELPGTVTDLKGNSAGLPLKESFPVGYTYYDRDEVLQVVERFGAFWYGIDYDPFGKNCNAFTELLIKHIADKQAYYYPSYVNRFTKLGAILRMWFKPLQEIVGDIVNYEDSEEEEDSREDVYIKVVEEGNYDERAPHGDESILPPIVPKGDNTGLTKPEVILI